MPRTKIGAALYIDTDSFIYQIFSKIRIQTILRTFLKSFTLCINVTKSLSCLRPGSVDCVINFDKDIDAFRLEMPKTIPLNKRYFRQDLNFPFTSEISNFRGTKEPLPLAHFVVL